MPERLDQCLKNAWKTTMAITSSVILNEGVQRILYNNEPSEIIIQNPVAEKILRHVIINSLIYNLKILNYDVSLITLKALTKF